MFICKGAAFKLAYLREAVDRGAVCYISEKTFDLERQVPYILVKDIREAMSVLANFFYNRPWEDLVVTGIGGTKGKSTSAYYMKAGKRRAPSFPPLTSTTERVWWSPTSQRRRR